MPNIEIKASLKDLGMDLQKARVKALELGAQDHGVIRQVDTYFETKQGRLKFRESSMQGQTTVGMLIPYVRADQGVKKSEYSLLTASSAEDALRARKLLSQILGVETVVEKRRSLYLWENVRIHLDEVVGHGLFIEFEAVYNDEGSDQDLREREAREYQKIEGLMRHFGIEPRHLIGGSYRERSLGI